ncbi:MAG: DUF1566 domain-containing protein [Sulfurimonas sp.]|uniref:Lcl domain-containing protein n=1 Tax=Sulfurimonas sp. TaxID=2022749 RepID=UPI00260EF033|nr:DUF1566 domain-containing protein [Sulfurimonas sp.]MDD5373264.1 DUF1566 domain-containing protein [Sulfurimonas sp.]
MTTKKQFLKTTEPLEENLKVALTKCYDDFKNEFSKTKVEDKITTTETWYDAETNLTWELKTPENATHRYVWGKENIPNAWNPEALTDDVKDTQSYIEKLNKENYGGFSDWRLPTLDELKDLCSKREITENGVTWTTTSWTDDTDYYWVWSGTSTTGDYYDGDYHVRCVR